MNLNATTVRVMVVAWAVAACGPSATEVKEARATRYTCEYQEVFRAVAETVKEETPPLGAADAEQGIVASQFRWHSSSGMRKEAGAAVLTQGDVGFLVEIAIRDAKGGGFVIAPLPRVFEQQPDSPRGRELTHEDATWPEWADTKVDNIMIEIRKRLSRCASTPTGGG